MDDEIVFEQFLHRIGLTLARQKTAVTDGLVQTFQQLSLLEDDDIDSFVKQVNEGNRNRPNNQSVNISGRVIASLKAVMFELQDRDKCVALLTAAELNSLDQATCATLRTLRADAIRDNKTRKSQKIPDMVVPKLTRNNWRDFKISIEEALQRTYGVNDIPLAYVIRKEDVNNFNVHYASRIERLTACTVHNGDAF